MKHLIDRQREIDRGKLTAAANLQKLTFRALSLRRSKVQMRTLSYQRDRGFNKGWKPGKLTGCQLDHAWLLLLLSQVVFLQLLTFAHQ